MKIKLISYVNVYNAMKIAAHSQHGVAASYLQDAVQDRFKKTQITSFSNLILQGIETSYSQTSKYSLSANYSK